MPEATQEELINFMKNETLTVSGDLLLKVLGTIQELPFNKANNLVIEVSSIINSHIKNNYKKEEVKEELKEAVE